MEKPSDAKTVREDKDDSIPVIKRRLRLGRLIFSGLSGTIGGPIFVILGGVIKSAGAGVIISLLLLGVLIFFLVMNYSELTLSLPLLGGGYSFSKEAIGGFWGFLIGWLMFVGNITFAALSAIGFGYSLAVFFPNRTGLEANFIPIIAITVIITLLALNLRWTATLTKIMNVFTFLIIFGFVFYIITGLILGPITNKENFDPLNLVTVWDWNGFFRVTPILFGIFCIYEWNSSFESIGAQFERIKEPEKNIPRSFIYAVLIAINIYVLTSLTTIMNMGRPGSPTWDFIGSSLNPLADTMALVTGPIGMYILGLSGMLCTITSTQAGFRMSYRIFYAMCRDGYIPKTFMKKVKYLHNPPLPVSIASGFIILSIIFFNINLLVAISNFGMLLAMGIISLSVILLRKRRPNLTRPFKVWGYPYTPIISGLISFGLVIPLAPDGLFIGIFLSLIGIFIFALKIARRERILLMLSGSKIGAALIALAFIYLVNNHFEAHHTIWIPVLDAVDGWLLAFLAIFEIITVYFDLRPIPMILSRQFGKGDSHGGVISEIFDNDTGKDVAYKINIGIGISMIGGGIIYLIYGIILLDGTIVFPENILGFGMDTLTVLGFSIFVINALILIINGAVGISTQLELVRAKVVEF